MRPTFFVKHESPMLCLLWLQEYFFPRWEEFINKSHLMTAILSDGFSHEQPDGIWKMIWALCFVEILTACHEEQFVTKLWALLYKIHFFSISASEYM